MNLNTLHTHNIELLSALCEMARERERRKVEEKENGKFNNTPTTTITWLGIQTCCCTPNVRETRTTKTT